MRVGVMTFTGRNYGAVLQATALLGTLREMGHEPELIDFVPTSSAPLSAPRRVRHAIWSRVAPLLAGPERDIRTQEFRENHLTSSAIKYVGSQQLLDDPPTYDAYVVGSDQVWNLGHTGHCFSYFLDFAPDTARKVSYAASFGHEDVPDSDRQALRGLLPRFDAISVRESSGVEIVRQLSGLPAFHALDPTLLWNSDKWAQYASPASLSDPYILVYMMPGNPRLDAEIRGYARKWSRAAGLRCIYLNQREYRRLIPQETNIHSAGPAEFLSLISQAAGVVTNSFHGTCFSIVFKRPFLSVYLPPGPAPTERSSRMISLLRLLGIQSQGLQIDRLSDSGRIPQVEWDYSEATNRLQVLRTNSRDFLLTALSC